MSKLHDGTLEEEAARLTKASGHFQRTLADNSSDVLQLAVVRPNEPLRINPARFFRSLTLVPMNMSNVVRLAEKRTDTHIVARHDCWVSLNRPKRREERRKGGGAKSQKAPQKVPEGPAEGPGRSPIAPESPS